MPEPVVQVTGPMLERFEEVLTPEALRLGSVGGIAAGDGLRAISDPENGQVGLYTLRAEGGR